MSARPKLEPGRVYRTRDFAVWTKNPTRLARQLVERGELKPLRQGLYTSPRSGRFGPVPPRDEAVMEGFLEGDDFVFTGPEKWNTLGLGTTALHANPLVYNHKQTGLFDFGNRQFRLRRVAFPSQPPAEWFVIDLFEHAEEAGVSHEDLTERLKRIVASGTFRRDVLLSMAERFGSKSTLSRIRSAVAEKA